MEDYRVSVGWRIHPKRIKLQRKLGHAGVLALMDLWAFAAQYRTNGRLTGMDEEDLAIACGWDGDVGDLLGTLVDLRLLDLDAGVYCLHGWAERNPYVASHADRSAKASKAAKARWGKKRKKDATSIAEQCSEHDLALLNDASSNAGSNAPHMQHASEIDAPSPDPDPSPDPNPDPDPPGGSINKLKPGPVTDKKTQCSKIVLDDWGGSVSEIVEYYCTLRPKRRGGAQSPETIRLIKQRLDAHSVADIKKAIDGACNDKWTTEQALDALGRIVATDDATERFMALGDQPRDKPKREWWEQDEDDKSNDNAGVPF